MEFVRKMEWPALATDCCVQKTKTAFSSPQSTVHHKPVAQMWPEILEVKKWLKTGTANFKACDGAIIYLNTKGFSPNSRRTVVIKQAAWQSARAPLLTSHGCSWGWGCERCIHSRRMISVFMFDDSSLLPINCYVLTHDMKADCGWDMFGQQLCSIDWHPWRHHVSHARADYVILSTLMGRNSAQPLMIYLKFLMADLWFLVKCIIWTVPTDRTHPITWLPFTVMRMRRHVTYRCGGDGSCLR